MAFKVISTNQTVQQLVNGADEVVLLEGVSVALADTAFLGTHDTTMSLFIYGSVASTQDTIKLGATPGDTSPLLVYIGETGTVVNTFRFDSRSAISISRFGADIVNLGEITAIGQAITFEADVTAGDVTNSGSIISTDYNAIDVAGSFNSLSGTFNISNSGEISGLLNGIAVSYQSVDVFNSGTISGNTGINIFNNSGQTNRLNVQNTGTIISTYADAISGGSGSDTVTNSGLIVGHVQLSGGDDTYDGTGGRVDGAVKGGAGNDTYIIDDPSISLVEFSASGTDTVQSSVGWTLDANFEDLTLLGAKAIRGIGNTENNVITGNDADNRLRGRDGDDTINGNGGDDNIRGQKGNDVLDGGYGDDLVKGNRGNDTLSGGAGDDLLKGGGGSDRYVFDFNNDGDDTLKEVGGGSDTLAVTGRVMSQLDFRRSGNDLVIESGGTVDRVVIDDFYSAGDAGRVELLETTTTTKYLQTGLTGGATDDIIVGFSGTQIIRGGAGDDILIGKGDKDRIYGGSGADRFDYDALSDSGTTSTTMDTIYDFVAGTDTIDLFDIDADSTTAGNQNFSFIGAGAYSGTAGELRYQFIGANTRLGVDVDGDMVDDFNILLAGNVAFSAGDFVL